LGSIPSIKTLKLQEYLIDRSVNLKHKLINFSESIFLVLGFKTILIFSSDSSTTSSNGNFLLLMLLASCSIILTLLTYKTEFGIFLVASFGSSMVLLYGYPESPFAQPKNVFFGHLVTAIVGMFFLYLIPLPLFIIIPLAVGFGVGLMILLNVTHPPAGGNPIIVIMGSVSLDYLLSPIISGSIIILVFAIIINRFILKKSYPKSK